MKKILLIDDSKDIHRLVTKAFASIYEVIAIDSWTKAIKHIHRVDLVLLDVKLHALRGDRMLKILNEDLDKPLRAVLYSSADERTLRRMSKEAGAIGYITKVSGIEMLKSKVSKYIASP